MKQVKDLEQAINHSILIFGLLAILQDEMDKVEHNGFKFNQLLKRKANLFKEEFEKEITFFYKNLGNEAGEKYFNNKVKELYTRLNSAIEDFDFEAI